MILLTMSAALAAPDPSAIQRKMSTNDYEGARKKCEKWEAEDPGADLALREVCAKADWPLAEARDTARVWSAYCEKWAGTEWADVAIERLASSTLRELRAPASEDDLLQVAEDFPDTKAARQAEEMAADAAVRDVADGNAALRAARRYPGHPGLPPLVERYPEKFVKVIINADQSISTEIDPPVEVPAYMTPMPVWVARWPGGHAEPWLEVATNHLAESGLPRETLALTGGGGPALPLCAIPGQPEGFHAAVEVRVGAGRVYRPVPWADDCGPEAPVMVMTVSGSRVVGLSPRPGAVVDLSARSVDGRRHTRAFVKDTPGDPTLAGPLVFTSVGRLWLVSPLNGGPPWLTDRAPPRDGAVALSASVVGSGPPADMRLEPVDGTLTLRKDGMDDWTLPPGEVRFLSPLVQRILGLDAGVLDGVAAGAPALLAQVPWARDDDKLLTAEPPSGGRALQMDALTELDVQQAMLRVESAGVGRDRFDVRDAWTVDVDKDGVVEVIFRGRLDEQGAVVVLDVHESLGNRLFAFHVEDAAPAEGEAGPPFAFTYGGSPYVAWVGNMEQAGFVELIRYDGLSMRAERLVLP